MVAPIANSAEAIQAIEFFIEKSKGSKVANEDQAKPTERISQSEYGDMLMAKDNHGNLKIATDQSYKRKMDELALQFQ